MMSNEKNSLFNRWSEAADRFEENFYAIIRQFGTDGFEWIVDDPDSDMFDGKPDWRPTGYLNSTRTKDFPLWKGSVFITSNLERLYRMWKRCEKDDTSHYRIVKLNLSVERVNHELLEAQMKIAARDEILSKLSEEDREIIMNAG